MHNTLTRLAAAESIARAVAVTLPDSAAAAAEHLIRAADELRAEADAITERDAEIWETA